MRLNLGLPHHCQNVYLISDCTGSGTRRCRCNAVQPLAGYAYPGNSINFSTVKLLHLCPEGASTSITSLQQKHWKKFMKFTKLHNYKFPGEYKNLLAYCFLSASFIFKLQKNGRVTCYRWGNKVTPAGKPERKPSHQKWVGWLAYRANRAACFQSEVQPKNRSWSVSERAELGQTSPSLDSVRVLRLHITVSLTTEGAEPSFEMSGSCFYALDHSALPCCLREREILF